MLSLDLSSRHTPNLAKSLLGQKLLCRLPDKEIITLLLTETESYDGPKDLASHASRGLTARNRPMFGPAGHWYVYLVYGLHWMLNLVTGPTDYPAAILIRGAVLLDKQGKIIKHLDGPAKLTKFLHLDKTFNNLPATSAHHLWLERGIKVDPKQITASPRIGVASAGPVWSQKPWRFTLEIGNK